MCVWGGVSASSTSVWCAALCAAALRRSGGRSTAGGGGTQTPTRPVATSPFRFAQWGAGAHARLLPASVSVSASVRVYSAAIGTAAHSVADVASLPSAHWAARAGGGLWKQRRLWTARGKRRCTCPCNGRRLREIQTSQRCSDAASRCAMHLRCFCVWLWRHPTPTAAEMAASRTPPPGPHRAFPPRLCALPVFSGVFTALFLMQRGGGIYFKPPRGDAEAVHPLNPPQWLFFVVWAHGADLNAPFLVACAADWRAQEDEMLKAAVAESPAHINWRMVAMTTMGGLKTPKQVRELPSVPLPRLSAPRRPSWVPYTSLCPCFATAAGAWGRLCVSGGVHGADTAPRCPPSPLFAAVSPTAPTERWWAPAPRVPPVCPPSRPLVGMSLRCAGVKYSHAAAGAIGTRFHAPHAAKSPVPAAAHLCLCPRVCPCSAGNGGATCWTRL